MHPRTPLHLAIVGFLLAGYAGWLGLTDATCFEKAVTVLVGSLGLLSVAAVAGNKLKLQRGVAIALLLMMAGMIASNLIGTKLLVIDLFHDPRYAAFLVGLLALNVVGLIRGSFLARWLSLALAGGGLLSSSLNLAPYATLRHHYTWTLAIGIAGSVLILANLLGSEQRKHFEDHASPLWSSPDPLLRSIRHTVMAFMAAVPMLLVFTWMQPIVPQTAATALPLAIFLSVAILAAAARRVAGAIALVIGGVGLLVQAVFTVVLARQSGDPVIADISLYYAIFWVPAGVTALVCGARMATPVLRLLSHRD